MDPHQLCTAAPAEFNERMGIGLRAMSINDELCGINSSLDVQL
jgi:hypothetical protein